VNHRADVLLRLKKIKMRLFIFLFLVLFSRISFAQMVVTGQVTDKQTGQPVAYAMIKAGPDRTFSNPEGKFKLIITEGDTLIKVTASFYSPTEARVLQNEELIIGLDPEDQNIEAITVTALRIESRLLNSTGAVSLLTGSQISRNSVVALEPSLNQVPGVFMHSGSLNTNRITIRGIGSRTPYGTSKIKAYLDEIPLTTGDGETTLEDISLRALSQVEVVRGPTSGVHGSGLGGAILLKTSPGNEAFKVQTNFMSGSYGTHKEGISVSVNREKSSHLLVTDFLYSDGYRENNRYNRSNLFSYNRFDLGEKGSLYVLFDFVDLKAFIPSSIDLATYRENPERAAANWANIKGNENSRKTRGAATYRHQLSAKTKISITGLAVRSTNLELRPFNLLEEEAITGSGRFSLVYTSDNFEWNSGTEFFREKYDWATYRNQAALPENRLSQNKEIRFWNNIFSLAKWNPLPSLAIEPGLNLNFTRYDYTDRFITDGDESGRRSFPWLLSPRLGTNWQFSERKALFAIVSHGFSAPSLQETLQPDGQVNSGIEPETGWNFEAGMRGKLLQNRLFYDISIYRMLIKNLLVARRTGDDAFVGVNAGKTSHTGLEFDLRYFGTISKKFHWNLYTNGTLASYRFDEFTDLDKDYSGNQLTGVPRVVLNGGLEVRTNKGWNSFVNYRHSGKLPLNDANSIYSEPYLVFNWSAGRNFQFMNLSWKVNGGVNNLFDTSYASMFLTNAPSFGNTAPRYYYPGLPRNYFVAVQIAFIN
jgi:iron complex outermembrane recepter protein